MAGDGIRGLFSELKRRKVYGVIAAYAIGAWVLIEVASVVLDAFAAPAWLLQLIIVGAVLGAPVAIVVSWIFDLTPKGFVRTDDIDAAVAGQVSAAAEATASADGHEGGAAPGSAKGDEAGEETAAGIAGGPERRRVTVLHASITVAGTADPEIALEAMPECERACAQAVERFEGYLRPGTSGEVVAYFGVPTAHEDDAARGVRAALAMLADVELLNEHLARGGGPRFELRAAVHTGLVVAEDLERESGGRSISLVGQTVQTPAALHFHAGPNEVLITGGTFKLVADAFVCEERQLASHSGMASGRVFRVARAKTVQDRLGSAQPAAIFGRDQELALLAERWALACEGRGQAVVLSGEPGIGKSRVVLGFSEQVLKDPRAGIATCQCSPYHRHSALHPIIGFLEQAIPEWDGDAPEAVRLEQLQGFLAGLDFPPAEAMPLFASLLSLPGDYAPSYLSPERQQQLMLEMLASILLQRAESRPVLFILEDVHWADPTTVELLGMLMEQLPTATIMLVVTSRPEFRAPWPQRSHVSNLAMSRLSARQVRSIAQSVAGSRQLPEKLLEEIIERTDGVPLFVEELTKSVIESGVLEQAARDEPLTIAIPDTLQESLTARLDRLGSSKALVQIAAAIGREFDHALLAAVAGLEEDQLKAQLEELLAAEFVYRRGHGAKARYIFKHALIQDAAYDSLLKSRRRDYHARIADALETDFPEVCESQPELLALHFAAAGNPARALHYHKLAADRAGRRSANREAVYHLREGLRLLESLDDEAEHALTELDLQMNLVPALVATKGYGSAELATACNRALALCDRVGNVPQKVFVLFGLWMFHVVRANHATSVQLASQFQALVQEGDDDGLQVEADLINGIAQFFVGQLDTAARHFEACDARYDRRRHGDHAFRFGQDPQVIAKNYLSWIYWIRGDAETALRTSREALQLARALEHPLTLSFALSFAGWLAVYRGDVESISRHAAEVIELCSEFGIQVFLAHGRVLEARAHCERSRDPDSAGQMIAALDFFRSLGARCFLPVWDAHLAMVHAAINEHGKAETVLERAFAEMQTSGERWAEPELHRATGFVLDRSGRPRSESEIHYRKALEIAQSLGMQGWARRAALSLADNLWAQDRKEETRELIAEFRLDYENGAGVWHMQDAEAILARIS